MHRKDRNVAKLNKDFWKKMGVLPHLDRLDERGKILPAHESKAAKTEAEEDCFRLTG